MKSAVSTLLLFGGSLKLSLSAGSVEWDYEGMSHWSDHFEFCGTNDQSPINIQNEHIEYDSSVCEPHLNWTVDWTVHDFTIQNNGHSVVLKPIQRLSVDSSAAPEFVDQYNRAYISRAEPIATLPNYFKPEGSEIEQFCLDSFHFHWGLHDEEGSEHLVDGHQYPLEVHFVHYACNRGNLGAALAPYATVKNVTHAQEAGEDYHELAVLGVFFEISEFDNRAFDQILSDDWLERLVLPEDKSHVEVVNQLYLQDIVPPEVLTDGYYSYEGSLTTPPCTNIVRWHVARKKASISIRQLAKFRSILSAVNHTSAPNYRETQRNVNTVYACFTEDDSGRSATATAIVWVWAVVVLIGMCCFMGCCYYKSLREARIGAMEPEKADRAKRQRLQSKSSIDHTHLRHGDESHTTPGGSTGGHSQTHTQTHTTTAH